MRLKLLQIGFFLAIQAPALLLAQQREDDSIPEIRISIEDGKVKLTINLNEPFRWEKTSYESIKKFPQPWIGSPDTPHQIWLEEKGVMEWRQTDMMFIGNYKAIGNSAKNILDQYIAKYGGIGLRTWSVDKEGNLQSFNETSGKNELFTPEAFAKKFELDFHQSGKYEIEGSVLGYLTEIIGVFNPETNLLNFDTLDYAPFFKIPILVIEGSKDMKKWSKVKLSQPLPKDYQWPKELRVELEAELKDSTLYRLKIEED